MPANAMMGKQHNHDPSELAQNGVDALREMPERGYGKSKNEIHTCRCGAIVVVPKGHDALDDDKETDVLCDECDKPLGVKLYQTFA